MHILAIKFSISCSPKFSFPQHSKEIIFPYKSIYFFISDSFESDLGGRADTRDPNNWFSIPFTEDFDYKAIRKMCREFEEEHPLDPKYINESTFTITL